MSEDYGETNILGFADAEPAHTPRKKKAPHVYAFTVVHAGKTGVTYALSTPTTSGATISVKATRFNTYWCARDNSIACEHSAALREYIEDVGPYVGDAPLPSTPRETAA